MQSPSRQAGKIGVLSDTHGHTGFASEALAYLDTFAVETVLHCGDVGTNIPPLLASWPTHFVLGNTDTDADALEAAMTAPGHQLHGRFGHIEHAGRRIALLHGDDGARLNEAIHSGAWDLVCYGHTHHADVRRVGSTLVLNPGALYRASRHTIAIVDLARLEAEIIPV